MRKITAAFLAAIFACSFLPAAYATQGEVRIIAPDDGAKVGSASPIHVIYMATFDNTGDHVHLYLDGQGHETLRNRTISRTVDIYSDGKWEVISRELNGRKAIGPLSPGRHRICIMVVDREHKPTGVEKCIEVVSTATE
ncbi:MAG TPA: hypothetical protein PLK99_04240 [Burkholderiales bacterium]|nr:hypothetical protein [Burkholderiales bacterium]